MVEGTHDDVYIGTSNGVQSADEEVLAELVFIAEEGTLLQCAEQTLKLGHQTNQVELPQEALTTSRRCWRRKPCGMLQAASCRSTKVMALFALSTTSITHSFNRVTRGHSCSLQSPAEKNGIKRGGGVDRGKPFGQVTSCMGVSKHTLFGKCMCSSVTCKGRADDHLLRALSVLIKVLGGVELLFQAEHQADGLVLICRLTRTDRHIPMLRLGVPVGGCNRLATCLDSSLRQDFIGPTPALIGKSQRPQLIPAEANHPSRHRFLNPSPAPSTLQLSLTTPLLPQS
ncbi:hypothetical protein EYF80_000090 [Liparis tanakae]|uniref:Uncharacterized protein n=1 Tax=Liparis tanakae TaxID=230148 RepID=A0A4Z2JHQ3_9TELE|nr:hypothetical protein EYF80_000090 [Liparis tanakae]